LTRLYQLGGAPTRGEITVQGRTFAVAGTTLWELFAPNLAVNAANRGTVPSDGNPVSIAGFGHQVLLASAGSAFVFDLNANTLTPVDPSGGGNVPVAMVTYAHGFFLALIENPATPWQINSSNAADATTWQATNFTIPEDFTDNANCIFTSQTLLWVFGPKGIQPYSNTGDFPFPFDPIAGTYIENGLAAPFSVARLDNSVFWLGSDERGTGMVWRANGFTPQRVSNHAIEYALQKYATIADAVAYSYQDQGHSFYVLNFPTADKTWVYDVATGSWHERGFWNVQAAKFNRHRVAFHTFNFGMHLVGDSTTGAVYQMAINIVSDFGNVIRRVRRGPHISKEGDRIAMGRLQIDAEVGIGPNLQGNQPATLFYLTDVDGNTWQLSVNDAGAYGLVESNVGAPAPLYLNDPASNTSWQIVPSLIGQPNAVSLAYNASYPEALQMTSLTGNSKWIMGVRQVAAGVGQITAFPLGIVGRGPLWMLAWSDDGAQTFSAPHARDGGMIGEYRRRLLWNRLGAPRDRVFELSITEAVSARVIEAYLKASGYEPSERLAKQIAKQT
jgi:hypothetical protein